MQKNNLNGIQNINLAEFDLENPEIVKRSTPYFLISKDRIKKNYADFKKYFPKAEIYYALKANAEPLVLETIKELGGCFEAASMYELDLLKSLKVAPEKIIYGTSVKPISHIKEFYKYGVTLFACDSIPEIEKIAAVAPGSKVFVRTKVNDSGSVFRFSEKFGSNQEDIISLLEHAKSVGLDPFGISFHVGSQASNVNAWADSINMLAPIILKLAQVGIDIQILNVGGGYPCQYASSETSFGLAEVSQSALKELNKLPKKVKTIMEPGRKLVANSAILICSVIGRVERNDQTWLFLDAGVYNGLFETMAYQGSVRYHITPLKPSYNAGESLFALAGPTGDSPDVITREALLPEDIAVGDKLIIHDVGAYSLVCVSPFNGFPKPDVYFI